MKQIIVDVFSETVFGGNPTAVCFVAEWPEDEMMRRIAMENRLSETAFVRKKDGRYGLRWFTAVREIPLCGHAALGAGYAVLRKWEPGAEAVTFDTLSGALTVAKRDGRVEMRMPRWPLVEVSVTEDMTEAVGAPVRAAYLARDLLCILEDEAAVRCAAPDMARVKALPGLLLNLAAKGTDCDCVVRSFAPKLAVDEDPACGSGQCHAFEWLAMTEGRTSFFGRQASARGGGVYGRIEAGEMFLSGHAALFSEGEIFPEGR